MGLYVPFPRSPAPGFPDCGNDVPRRYRARVAVGYRNIPTPVQFPTHDVRSFPKSHGGGPAGWTQCRGLRRATPSLRCCVNRHQSTASATDVKSSVRVSSSTIHASSSQWLANTYWRGNCARWTKVSNTRWNCSHIPFPSRSVMRRSP